jgi:hypothetical protein
MTETPPTEPAPSSLPAARERIAVVIFGTTTPAGRTFDVWLLILIVASVVAVMLESVEAFSSRFGDHLPNLGLDVHRGVPGGVHLADLGGSRPPPLHLLVLRHRRPAVDSALVHRHLRQRGAFRCS